jgi:hypothetical protein
MDIGRRIAYKHRGPPRAAISKREGKSHGRKKSYQETEEGQQAVKDRGPAIKIRGTKFLSLSVFEEPPSRR